LSKEPTEPGIGLQDILSNPEALVTVDGVGTRCYAACVGRYGADAMGALV